MSTIEKTLVTFSFLVFCLSAVAIFKYDILFESNKFQVIARVESVTNESRVKSPNSHEYKILKPDDPITNGDNLFSGKNAKIMVKFVDGPKIMIGEESSISLREIDGQPDLKIDQGSFSGSFEEGDVLDVIAGNEVISLNGEKDTQFSVSHQDDGKVEIGSYDKELEVEFRGEKYKLTNEKASISQTEGVKLPRRMSGQQMMGKSKSPNANKGVAIESVVKRDQKGLTLEAPYPKENHIFLHNNGGKIPVFPKAQCKGACELKISLNGQDEVKKVFARSMIPVLYLNIEAKSEAKITWVFSDGGKETIGHFEVLINNADNFKKALDKKLPVEILN